MSARAGWLRVAPGPLFALVWFLASASAGAHPAPTSSAFIDFTVDGARIEQDVPIEEIERAMHRTLAEEGEPAESIARRHGDLLRAYAGSHLRARPAGGEEPWSVEVTDVRGHASDDGPRALFRFTLRSPHAEAAGSIQLHDDIVAHEVVSHYTAIYVRSDWAAGVAMNEPRLVGTIHAGRHDVTIARSGSFSRGLWSVVALGAEHIATGTDHLMFVFALVLVAPVAAEAGRWRGRRGTREALLAIARVVTAFTIGHSLTLALGALTTIALPVAVVESAIALSILLTAFHALRPIFPGREAVLAGMFGLVHGLAFASSLPQRDLGRAQTAWTLLGFNTGIELAQLGLLFLVAPWLLILARTRAYPAFRVAGACISGLLAAGWLLERTTDLPNPTSPAVAWMQAHPIPMLVTLAVIAMVCASSRAQPERPGGPISSNRSER